MLRRLSFLSKLPPSRFYNACASDNPINFTQEDIGKIYTIPKEASKTLNLREVLPKPYRAQLDTLRECSWLCRGALVESIACLKAVRTTFPSLRLVIYGQQGTGKTITLNQIVHFGHSEGWVVWHVPRSKLNEHDEDDYGFSIDMDKSNPRYPNQYLQEEPN